MFEAGMHLGYARSSRHPKMAPYVYGLRNNVQIFDIEKVGPKLREAFEFITSLGREKKTILFVGTKAEAKNLIEETGKKLSMPYVSLRWLGGTLTNMKEIRRRVDLLEDFQGKKTSGELLKFKKKERVRIEDTIDKMVKNLGSLSLMRTTPAAIVLIDPKHELITVNEARVVKVPVIALLNTDCDPEKVQYPVPGNDASRASIKLFLQGIEESYLKGLSEAEEIASKVEAN